MVCTDLPLLLKQLGLHKPSPSSSNNMVCTDLPLLLKQHGLHRRPPPPQTTWSAPTSPSSSNNMVCTDLLLKQHGLHRPPPQTTWSAPTSPSSSNNVVCTDLPLLLKQSGLHRPTPPPQTTWSAPTSPSNNVVCTALPLLLKQHGLHRPPPPSQTTWSAQPSPSPSNNLVCTALPLKQRGLRNSKQHDSGGIDMTETHEKPGWSGCSAKLFGVLMLAMVGLEVIYVNFSVKDVQTKTSPFYKCNRSVETKVVTKVVTVTNTVEVEKFSNISFPSHQNVRKQMLRQYCAGKLKPGDSRNTNYMIYSSNARLLYCFIPKVACTTWKRLFQVMDKKMSLPEALKVDKNDVHNLKYSKFKPVDSRQKDFMERSFYTFMITRHPFERLVGTYRNKLDDPYTPFFQNVYGSRILRRFRKGLTEAQYKAGAGVRFEEFLKFIIETKTFDEHWERMTRLCHPCYYKYDYLAKMETLVPDSKQILKNARLDYKFPENAKDRYKQQASALMLKYYSNITKSDLTKLYAIYKEDFEAFNYQLPQFIKDKLT